MKSFCRNVVAGLLLVIPWACSDHKPLEPALCSAEALTRCPAGWYTASDAGRCYRLFFLPDGTYRSADCDGNTTEKGSWTLTDCRIKVSRGLDNVGFYDIKAATPTSLTLYVLAGVASRNVTYTCQ